MATYTSDQMQELRSRFANNTSEQRHTKPQINAALQAVEDFMQQASTRTSVASAIETASPGIFTGPDKTLLFALWADTFAKRQGVN